MPVGFGLRIDKFFVAVAGQQVAIQGFVVGSNAVFGNIVKVLQVIVVGLLVKRFMEFVINFLQNLGTEADIDALIEGIRAGIARFRR